MEGYKEIGEEIEHMINEKKYNETLEFIDAKIKTSSDKKLLSLLLYKRGRVYYYLNRFKDVEKSLTGCLSVIDDVQDPEFKGELIFHIATLYLLMGDLDNALHLYEEVLNTLEENSYYHLIALHNIADIHKRIGNYETAMKNFKICYDKAIEYGDNPIGVYASYNIAEIYAINGDRKRAKEYIEKSIALAKKSGKRGEPWIMEEEVSLSILNGDNFEKIKTIAEKIKKRGTYNAHNIADTYYAFSVFSDQTTRKKLLEEAILLYSEAGDGYMRKKAIEKLELEK